MTHPRVLFLLAFLVSSVAKRDAIGRKPKRKVFAGEGVASWDKEVEQELICECRRPCNTLSVDDVNFSTNVGEQR